MIAVIMAAGKGSRLGDYTTDLPKSLLPLNDSGITLLDYNLDVLNKLGIDKILLVTGFNSQMMENHTKDNSKIEIIYNPFWDACNVLGSLYMVLDHIEQDFLFLHADTLADLEIWNMLTKEKGQMVLPYEKKACGEEEMKVRLNKQNILLEISKEIPSEDAQGEFLGIAKFSKETVPYFKSKAKDLFKGGNLNHYMEAVVQSAISETKIDIKVMDILEHKFVEVDFEEDYQKAKKLFGKQQNE
ncbi:MAG: choline kinase [Maribacter sp.]|jgi:choline kinase